MELAKERKIFVGLAALLAVSVFGLSWYVAALSDPAWVFGTNYLSDLGVSDVWTSKMFFNLGCLFAGTLFMWFGLGLLISKAKKLERAAGLLAVIAGLTMAMIGIIVETEDMHKYIAYTTFGTGILTLAVLAVSDWKTGRRLLASFTVAGVVLGVLMYVLLCTDVTEVDMAWCFLEGLPGIETLGMIILLFLFTFQGMKYLYNGALELQSPDGKGISDRHRLAYGFTVILAAVSFLMFWLFAFLSSTSWGLGEDAMYMLGLSDGDTGVYYALACLTGGVFLVLYGAGSGMMHRGYARSMSGLFAALMGIVLILKCGAFMTSGNIDYELIELVSVAMGVFTLTCITIADWQHKKMVTAAFYLIILVCGLAALLFFGYVAAATVATLAFFIVLIVEGIRLINNS